MKKKVLIICANYYPVHSKNLILNAESYLKKAKVKSNCIYVPGIFEIPVVISKNIKKFDGFLALGCVIKGETPHFDYISRSTFDALMNLSVKYKKPIGNGIITALNESQVIRRTGSNLSSSKLKKGGKGLEAARAVIEVLNNGT